MRKTNFRWPRAPLSSRPLSPRPPLQGQAAAPKGPAFLFLLNYRRRFPLPSYSTSIPFSRSSRSTSMKPDGARRWHVGKPLLVAFQWWTIFDIHWASLRSIANCVKLAYLGGGSGNPARATIHLTAGDSKGTDGGKEAQERRSGGWWPCTNRQNHPNRGPC